MKNQEKLKAFVNGADVGNQAQCTQMLVTWVAAKFKLWDTLTAGLFNLNTCTNLRTRYRVLEADLRLLPLLRWSSL